MNRNRRLAWLFVFGFVAIAGTIGVRAVMCAAARRYVGAALDIMQEHSVMRREVNWASLRAQAFQRSRSALTPFQTYDTIRFALSSLGDHHSGLIEPDVLAQLSALTIADNPLPQSRAASRVNNPAPQGRIVSGRVGYVLVPPFVGISQESIDASATGLHRIIREIGAERPCGWIVDLQNNDGGNMWPMLAGLGAILGDGPLGAFRDPNNVEVRWSYENGAALEGTRPRARVSEPPYRTVSGGSPVAVLTNKATASSAEAVAIAFQGRPYVRTFGERTRGQTTSNDQFPLRDGAILNLSVSWFVDRTGRLYPDGIAPEEPTAGGAADAVQATAQNWLLSQPVCRDSGVRP